MTRVYINQIAAAVPDHDVHQTFVSYAPNLLSSEKDRRMFRILAHRAQIEHRYSVLAPHPDAIQFDADNFYERGNFPTTKERMKLYKKNALPLACKALDQINFTEMKEKITHIIVTTCTGFYAPGLDQAIIRHYGLHPAVERTIVGFMGCQAAINALKLSNHIVRSNTSACVVILNLELCTLHLQEADDIDQIMSFLIFADGCAASIVSDDPIGIEMLRFHSGLMPDTQEEITWHIGDTGFDMILARSVPATITSRIGNYLPDILAGQAKEDIIHWAIHPGGRAILDAVQTSLNLREEHLETSRNILRQFGNMSSATLMFVLNDMLNNKLRGLGCALAFGPGLTLESMLFKT